ncbi:MAG: ECF transporter S component [Candidatus Saccharibacteria bacterium]
MIDFLSVITFLKDLNWGLTSFLLLAGALLFFLWRADRSAMGVRDITLVATLSAVAALGRVPFAALPGIQPTTFMVTVAGMVFGGRAGFLVGCLGALVSNFFLGQGPWTVWQMAAWGLTGVCAGWWGKLSFGSNRWGLALFGVIWAFLFGWIMNIQYWITFTYPLTLSGYLTACATSLWFDVLHAASNAVLGFIIGPDIIRLLKDYRLVFETASIEIIDEETPDVGEDHLCETR